MPVKDTAPGLGRQLGGGLRYVQTFLVLLGDLAGRRGWRFAGLMVAIIATAVVHPLPFLLVAELLHAASSGGRGGAVTLGRGSFSLALPGDAGIGAVFVLGVAAFVLSYATGRLVNREVIRWQDSMFWEIVARLPRLARWDRRLEPGCPLRPQALAVRIDVAVRSAFLIGRLVETGLRDALMVAVLLGVLIWQDAVAVAVLAFMSCLFLPIYGLAIGELARAQAKANAMDNRLRQPMISILKSELAREAGLAVDAARLEPSAVKALSRGYGTQSRLLNRLNAVTCVAGIHVFAAFYAIFLADGRRLADLPAGKITFFVLLLLLLRALVGLIGLVTRLSRGYERLALLRRLLRPASKPLQAAAAGSEPTFALVVAEEARPVRLGETLVMLAPDVSYAYQLLPLANALVACFGPEPGMSRHIPLLRFADIPALADRRAVRRDAVRVRLEQSGGEALWLTPEPDETASAPVVALTWAAWQRARREQRLDGIARGRLIVLAVGPENAGQALPEEALACLSDGRSLLAVGTLAEMRDALVRQTGAARQSGGEADELEEAA